jgi:hypothetical protein
VIGLALLAVGAVLLWAALTGRAENVLTALKMDLPTIGAGNYIVGGTSGGGGSGSSGGSPSGGGGSGSDIGTHDALTDGGLAYVINKTYGNMTDQEKHDANNAAHQNSNLGSSTG